jgi:dynein heavy chain
MTRIKDMYDCFYAFAMIWGFGGCLDESKREFNGYLRGACNQLKFPEGGTVYDYFYDPVDHKWVHWLEKVKPFDTGYTGVFSSLVVGTAETARQTKLLTMHLEAQKGIVYVGTAGTGKTTIVKNYFKDADPDLVLNTQINFNSYTDSMSL